MHYFKTYMHDLNAFKYFAQKSLPKEGINHSLVSEALNLFTNIINVEHLWGGTFNHKVTITVLNFSLSP